MYLFFSNLENRSDQCLIDHDPSRYAALKVRGAIPRDRTLRGGRTGQAAGRVLTRAVKSV